MADTKSPWRLRARAAIAKALDALPWTATRSQVREALAAVGRRYRGPAGTSPGWPYRAYLVERRIALQSPLLRKGGTRPRVLCLPAGVRCGWCGSRGCIMCGAARARHAATDWQGWDRATLDQGTTAVLADFLEENGFQAESEYYRNGGS